MTYINPWGYGQSEAVVTGAKYDEDGRLIVDELTVTLRGPIVQFLDAMLSEVDEAVGLDGVLQSILHEGRAVGVMSYEKWFPKYQQALDEDHA